MKNIPCYSDTFIGFLRLNIFCKTNKETKATGKETAAFSGVTLSAMNIIMTLTKDKNKL